MNAETHKLGREIGEYIDKKVDEGLTNKVIPAVTDTMNAKFNGKLDSFRAEVQESIKEQNKVLEEQNKKLEQIYAHTKGTSEMLGLYNGFSSFSKGIWILAKWITALAGAALALWAFTKFVISSVLK